MGFYSFVCVSILLFELLLLLGERKVCLLGSCNEGGYVCAEEGRKQYGVGK